MKKILFTLLFLSVIHGAFSQTSSKDQKVKQLLELTGAGKMGAMFAQQMMAGFEQQFPNVPAEFWEKLKAGLNSDEITTLTIPIYSKYYTEDDLDQLIKFYKTPVGQKVIAVSPQVMQESMAIGQEWGRKMAEKIVNELKAKGYQQKSEG